MRAPSYPPARVLPPEHAGGSASPSVKAAANATVMRDGFSSTGDVATRETDGYITFIGRTV